jgi:hypothetical protein
MNRTQHRLLSILATGAVALTAGVTPALAGSDGCDDEDSCQAPAQVVPAPPAPVTLQAPPAPEGGDTQPERSSSAPAAGKKQRVKAVNVAHRTVANRTVANRTVAQRTVPQGAVAAGAGGTAPHGPDSALLGLGAGLVLLVAGGRLVAAGRS